MNLYKTLIFLLMLVISTNTSSEGINWYRTAANTTLVADWLQTHEIATHDRFYETNHLLGEQPSTGAVNRYFITSILLTNLIGEALPDKYSKFFYVGVALVQTKVVLDNYSMGVRINF